MKKALIIIIVALALVACGGKKQDNPDKTPDAAVPTAVTPPDAAPASTDNSEQGADDSIEAPTEVDFEESASSEIDEKNLESSVKAIESELAR